MISLIFTWELFKKLFPVSLKWCQLTMLPSKNYWTFLSEAKIISTNGNKNGGIFSKMAQFKKTYSFYNPYCSWFHICKCTYSLKRIHNLKISTWESGDYLWAGTRWWKHLLPDAKVSGWGQMRWCPAFQLQLSYC